MALLTRLFRELPLRLRFSIRKRTLIYCLGLLLAFQATPSVVVSQIGYGEAFASLQTNRDRLLAQYASERGYSSACEIWGNMTASQKGVFLTITDLLGRRSFMNAPRINYQLIIGRGRDSCIQMNGKNTDCNRGCYVRLDVNSSVCSFASGYMCAQHGKCTATPERNEYDMSLNHILKFYAINGGGSSCGGSSNRIFLQADQTLIYNLRNIWFGLPMWRNSSDITGAHSPFTQSRETHRGQPRGQTHQWAWDYEASYLFRENFVNAVYDPSIVEIDIDYNIVHDSNPECYYGGIQGRYYYQDYWSGSGLGGTAELGYSPCG
jgi:hypothetical protein